jgi:long-chain acyl-CoA synthetase
MADRTTPWLDNYPPGVAEQIDIPRQNLAQLLEDAAARFPDRPALHFEGRMITYRELAEQAWRFAGALAAMGVRKGDRVGTILPNSPQAVIALFGIWRLGAVAVQNNPTYTKRELAHQLADADVQVLITLDLIYDKVKEIRAEVPIREVIVTSVLDELGGLKRILAPYTKKGKASSAPVGRDEPVRRWREVLASSPGPAPMAAVDPDTDLALLQYTGGTTGLSKGVMLSHVNVGANTAQIGEWLPDLEPGREVFMCVLPFFHAYGLTTTLTLGIGIGAALVLQPRFEVGKCLDAIDKYRPTVFPGVPTLYVAINNAPDIASHDLSSIKACVSGAAPLPLEVSEEFERHAGGRLVEGYGLSEASPVTHANPVYGKRKVGTIGLPIPNTIARVVDAEDITRELPVGEPGELAVQGPQVMKGYWNRPEETDGVLKDGWLLTGDMATMDDEGYFAIVDRKKDLIITGGYNIYPREVEEVLYEHPKVKMVCVAGIPNSYMGEVVKAWVVLREGQEATSKELRDFAAERLASYKVPRSIELRDELPMTLVGKVLRRKLVEEETAKAKAEPAQDEAPDGDAPGGGAPGGDAPAAAQPSGTEHA